MKTIGYVRVSTSAQAEEGISLEAQEAKIRAWADLNGYDEISIHVDAGISGSRADNREGLQTALRIIGKNDVLVVYSLSRLARSTKDTLEIAESLMKKNADLVSLSEKIDTTTAAGKMVFRMLAVLNEFERDQIAERTKTAMAHKKSKGELVGAIPYGFQLSLDGKTLRDNPEEQRTISAARRMKQHGMSLRTIAAELASRGHTARNGGRFAPMQIARMVAP